MEKSAIKELQVDGNITDDEKDIIQEIRRFYSKLYAKSEEGLCENINFFPKLTENQRKLCEGKINHGECIEIWKEMQLNKSPENDGLNV